MKQILITGATGTFGKAVIKKLDEINISYKIASRNPEEAKQKLHKIDIVPFAFDDPGTYEKAIENVDRVFILGPSLVLKMDELIAPFLDFLLRKNIKKVAYLSAISAEKMGEMLDFHPKIEKKLITEDFDYTIIRSGFLAQNFKTYEWDNITKHGITFNSAGNGKVAFLDVNNLAEIVAKALTEPGHDKKTYELTGPETLSFYDAAKVLSDITRQTIVYPNPSPEDFKQALANAGVPEFVGDYMNNVYSVVRNGAVDFTTDTYEKLTGKKPNSLESVLQNDFKN